MSIITKSIDTAAELKSEFAEYNRDHYSMVTYEGIVQFYEDCYTEPQELDVIAWCCDLNEEYIEDLPASYSDIEERINDHREENATEWDEDDEPVYTLWDDDKELTEEEKEIVLEYISEQTCVIASDDEIIAYLAF